MDAAANYSEKDIQTLDWKEHIRRRPGMYIGKLGDGSSPDDGIYVLLKEVLDNSIDEYAMGFCKRIDITINEGYVSVRDYGRGIPLGKVVDVVSKMNTGAKYDSKAFKTSVGLNGFGVKAVNALSVKFDVTSYREGQSFAASFMRGEIVNSGMNGSDGQNGTLTAFLADTDVFGEYNFNMDYVEAMVKIYVYLHDGLTITLTGNPYISKNGLLDLLNENLNEGP